MLQPPDKPKPRLIWRGLFCLLMGGLIWWLALKLIEPKPLWTTPVLSHQGSISVFDIDEEQGQVLIWEDPYFYAGGGIATQPRLQLLSLKDGTRGKSLQYRDPLSTSLYAHFQLGNIWQMIDAGEGTYELSCWNWKSGLPEQVVQKWKVAAPFRCELDWPEKRQRLIVGRTCDGYELMKGLPLDQLGLFGYFLAYALESDRYRVSNNQLLEISYDGKPTCRCLRTWSSKYRSDHSQLTPNGLHIVSLQSTDLPPWLLEARLKQQHKQEMTARELLELLGMTYQAIELTDAVSGQVLQTLLMEPGIVLKELEVAGNLVLVNAEVFELDRTIPREKCDKLETISTTRYLLYQVVGDRLIPRELPSNGDHLYTVRLQGHNNSLYTYRISADNEPPTWLVKYFTTEDEQLKMRGKVFLKLGHIHAGQQHKTHIGWINGPAPFPSEVEDFCKDKPWLQSMLAPYLEKPVDTVVYDADFRERWCWRMAENQIYTSTSGKQYLFVLPYDQVDANRINTAVRCYLLPLVTCSYWWARGVGLGTVVLAWLLLRWRFQRLHRAGSAIS